MPTDQGSNVVSLIKAKIIVCNGWFCCPGMLIMDAHLHGQVFVKGVWVNDMRKDGLSAGVDFYRMRLDRDRRAVVHKSDIDHQV